MIKGIALALSACFVWGLIFIIPLFLDGFTPIEITLGRYFFYGVISLFILFKERLQDACRYPAAIWIKTIYFSFVSTFGYYIPVIIALRYSAPAICTLILGISPITIAFYGNWKQRECSFKTLIIPSLLIVIGLVIINVPYLKSSTSLSEYGLGLLCGFSSMMAWSWYVVANAKFLKDNQNVSAGNWSTMIGVMTLFWVAIFSLIFFLFNPVESFEKYLTPSRELTYFLIGSTFLGFICSWLGGFLWNRASSYLPVSLAGQLTIFETIFGLIFVYILNQQVPPQLEFLGIALLLGAVIYGIRFSPQTDLELA